MDRDAIRAAWTELLDGMRTHELAILALADETRPWFELLSIDSLLDLKLGIRAQLAQLDRAA